MARPGAESYNQAVASNSAGAAGGHPRLQGLVGVIDPADFFAEAKIFVGIFDPAGSAVALGGTTTTQVVAVLRSAARDGCAGGPVMQQCRLWTPPLPMGTTCSSSTRVEGGGEGTSDKE